MNEHRRSIAREIVDMQKRPAPALFKDAEFRPAERDTYSRYKSFEGAVASGDTVFTALGNLGVGNSDYDPLKTPVVIEPKHMPEGLDGKSSDMSGYLDGMGHE